MREQRSGTVFWVRTNWFGFQHQERKEKKKEGGGRRKRSWISRSEWVPVNWPQAARLPNFWPLPGSAAANLKGFKPRAAARHVVTTKFWARLGFLMFQVYFFGLHRNSTKIWIGTESRLFNGFLTVSWQSVWGNLCYLSTLALKFHNEWRLYCFS